MVDYRKDNTNILICCSFVTIFALNFIYLHSIPKLHFFALGYSGLFQKIKKFK